MLKVLDAATESSMIFKAVTSVGVSRIVVLVLAFLLLLASLSSARSQESLNAPTQEARAYLKAALDLLETRFIRRDTIDWISLREQVTSLASNAKTLEDMYPAIKLAVELLEEPHTSFSRPSQGIVEPNNQDTGMWILDGVVIRVYSGGPADNAGIQRGDRIIQVLENTLIEDTSAPPGPPSVTLGRETHFDRSGIVHSVVLEASAYSSNHSPAAVDLATILLLELPGHFSSGRVAGGRHYSQILLNALSKIDSSTCGVIIDLRLNTGGNLWPMLAGLHTLLSHEEFGAFLRPFDDNPDSWRPALQRYLQEQNLGKPRVAQHDLPLALLTSRYTSSSGELAAIAFRGQDRAITIGEPTSGVPTVNTVHTLADGAQLVLTELYALDRSGKVYTDSLEPDVLAEVQWALFGNPQHDPVIAEAMNWFGSQGCTSSRPL